MTYGGSNDENLVKMTNDTSKGYRITHGQTDQRVRATERMAQLPNSAVSKYRIPLLRPTKFFKSTIFFF